MSPSWLAGWMLMVLGYLPSVALATTFNQSFDSLELVLNQTSQTYGALKIKNLEATLEQLEDDKTTKLAFQATKELIKPANCSERTLEIIRDLPASIIHGKSGRKNVDEIFRKYSNIVLDRCIPYLDAALLQVNNSSMGLEQITEGSLFTYDWRESLEIRDDIAAKQLAKLLRQTAEANSLNVYGAMEFNYQTEKYERVMFENNFNYTLRHHLVLPCRNYVWTFDGLISTLLKASGLTQWDPDFLYILDARPIEVQNIIYRYFFCKRFQLISGSKLKDALHLLATEDQYWSKRKLKDATQPASHQDSHKTKIRQECVYLGC